VLCARTPGGSRGSTCFGAVTRAGYGPSMTLTIADEWPGAWELVPWSRPDDWRDVADLVAWDIAVVGAGWVHLEAFHQVPERQRSYRLRLDVLADVLRADLPFLLGVGPSSPSGDDQPQLPLVLVDDPPLERLAERPAELSWRMYFWMTLQRNLPRTLRRARGLLRWQALEDRGLEAVLRDLGPDDLDDDERFDRLLGDDDAWWRARATEDVALAERLGEQVALQVEFILREQLPTVMPLLEEAIAVGVEDAALGGAVHIETDAHSHPVALRLVSHDGRPRAPVWTLAGPGAPLRDLVAGVGLRDLAPDPRSVA
jgi:hypothetical protein